MAGDVKNILTRQTLISTGMIANVYYAGDASVYANKFKKEAFYPSETEDI